MGKIKLGLLFGGKSTEHEVSIQSAKNILNAIDTFKYEVTLIGINKQGTWCLLNSIEELTNEYHSSMNVYQKNKSLNDRSIEKVTELDVVFPILLGSFGEDGSIQGMMRVLDIPFVGSNVLSSAICMDKEMTKKILSFSNVKVAKWITVKKSDEKYPTFNEIVEKMGVPFIIKPASQGSSVGVSIVYNETEYTKGLQSSFLYDNKVLIEEFIKGREVECAILGNDNPIASLPGEVVTNGQVYSYEKKYTHDQGIILETPAQLLDDQVLYIQEKSIEVYKILECEGLARVDFFLVDSGELIVNEINTFPAFTNFSLYPKLWEVSGIPYGELIDKLIELSLEKHQMENELQSTL
ncbi:D-alanine--D-alanine ligase family protein [Gracilibacillus sp. HCP3S3_G5_1]|uniref:D-alanine--D-alanine ligase family protein n=1 Tax=unclassified Gracilibacillus TaxID=2625209 RepID=UPI003F888DFD